jgi:hypothetical protein
LSKYTFREGRVAPNFKINFEQFLFNEERHRYSQSTDNWTTFSLINEDAHQVEAQVHFCISNATASSPCKAPFGSFEFCSSLPSQALSCFLSDIERELKILGVKKIIIKDTAHQYRLPQSTLLNVLFLNSGFGISRAEINSAIVIDDVNFENKISYAEVKRLRRSKYEQLDFRVLSMERLEAVYAFIKACRKERGMSLSMTLPQLQSTIQSCEGNFLLFGVFQRDELIAASISVKVNDRILFDFYHAHPKSFDQLSPVVALVNGIYSYGRQNKFEILDLGTSTVEGKINFSLLNFKTQLGGQLSMKFIFEKYLI